MSIKATERVNQLERVVAELVERVRALEAAQIQRRPKKQAEGRQNGEERHPAA